MRDGVAELMGVPDVLVERPIEALFQTAESIGKAGASAHRPHHLVEQTIGSNDRLGRPARALIGERVALSKHGEESDSVNARPLPSEQESEETSDRCPKLEQEVGCFPLPMPSRLMPWLSVIVGHMPYALCFMPDPSGGSLKCQSVTRW